MKKKRKKYRKKRTNSTRFLLTRQYLDTYSIRISKQTEEKGSNNDESPIGWNYFSQISSTRQSNDRESESNRSLSIARIVQYRDGYHVQSARRKFPRVDRAATVQLARASVFIFKSCTARRWHAEIARPWSSERFLLPLSRWNLLYILRYCSQCRTRGYTVF